MSKAKQLPLCPELEPVQTVDKNELRRKKRKWEKGFQAYSDKMHEVPTTASGKCGYMDFCDCCADPGNKNPCVRAFNEYARENNIKVDYDDFDFSKYI